jgi:uncharacterized protein (TIGR02145 family)
MPSRYFQWFFIASTALVAINFFSSCNPDEELTDSPIVSGNLPSLTTLPVSNISFSTATSGGNITNIGGSAITQQGVVWGTTPNPTTANNFTSDGTGSGSFTSNLSGLTINTTYYVRAYATNSVGTAYGDELSFTTTNNSGGSGNVPSLTTLTVSDIAGSSATSGGTITNTGVSNVTQRGVVWGITPNPTTTNSSTNDGIGSGSFTSNLIGLTANTTYYVRAYATNSAGTAYGNEVSFTTTENSGGTSGWLNPNLDYGSVTDQDGNNYATIVINNQEWMAENLRTTVYSNGDPIPNVTGSSQWTDLTTGAWTYYNNDSQYDIPYGKLYNWYAVEDPRNVCPTGWHVPSDAEWSALINYLVPWADGGSNTSNTAGRELKSTGTQYWISPNNGATNESGFSGLPGGKRIDGGSFYDVGGYGYWWSSTEIYPYYNAWYRFLGHGVHSVQRFNNHKNYGFSVRCLRD